MVANASSGTNYFNLYLKKNHYSVVQTNVLPTAGNAIQVVAAFLFGILADRTGKRLYMIIIIEVLVLVSNILLSIWNVQKGALLFAFYLSYCGSAAQPIIIVSRSPGAQVLIRSRRRTADKMSISGVGTRTKRRRSEPSATPRSNRKHLHLHLQHVPPMYVPLTLPRITINTKLIMPSQWSYSQLTTHLTISMDTRS
jgi:hypothetical protein